MQYVVVVIVDEDIGVGMVFQYIVEIFVCYQWGYIQIDCFGDFVCGFGGMDCCIWMVQCYWIVLVVINFDLCVIGCGNFFGYVLYVIFKLIVYFGIQIV